MPVRANSSCAYIHTFVQQSSKQQPKHPGVDFSVRGHRSKLFIDPTIFYAPVSALFCSSPPSRTGAEVAQFSTFYQDLDADIIQLTEVFITFVGATLPPLKERDVRC